jgi:serine/threonine protein kinase
MGAAKKLDGKNHGGVGHYILGKTIGEGTFGKVKLGTHILTGETVAVKILEREKIKEIADVQRVAREIHILKRVQHPHIIQLYEIIETPRQLFLIMEYCSGGELFDHIVECGRVQESDAWRFMHQILSGVEQIHKINVVHRDLKPENLLLSKEKSIKIVDFGLSNIYKDDQLLKTACGSPCYAPPEMIAGHWYVPSRCDVWSCGVIMFALVCGYLPFEDTNTRELYNKILNAEYRTPKFISPSAKDLIGAMLTIDPEDRITIPEIRQHPWYRSQDPNAPKKILVEDLPLDCDDIMLRNFFSKFGDIAEGNAFVKSDRKDRCGYVTFEHYFGAEEVSRVREELRINDTKVKVTVCDPSSDAADVISVKEEFEEDVLSQLFDLGFERADALECLKAKRHNQVTTTYFLLLLKKRRLAEQQVGGAHVDALGQHEEEYAEEEHEDTQVVFGKVPQHQMQRTRGKHSWRTPVGSMQGCISSTGDADATNCESGRRTRERGGGRRARNASRRDDQFGTSRGRKGAGRYRKTQV